MAAMTGLLLTGGEGPERARLEPYLAAVDVVVAADSGLDLANRVGLVPDLVVGDMDSVSDPRLLHAYGDRVLRFRADKDETDTEIGLRLLSERGADRVILAGGGGGRLAHLAGLLALFERPVAPHVWLTAREQVEVVAGLWAAPVRAGETISFFPIGGLASIAASRGLKWPLDGLRWSRGDAGISNVATADRVEVDMADGRLLMIREWL
jgi:thiamine pyrophosphokinase